MRELFVVLFWLLLVAVVDAQTPYYQGKTIRIISGYPAGDVNDLAKEVMAQPPAVIERMKKVLGE